MAPDKKSDKSNRIPISFLDADTEAIPERTSESGPADDSDEDQELPNQMTSDNEATAPAQKAFADGRLC